MRVAPEPTKQTVKPRTYHARCCKATESKGLCGCGNPPKGRAIVPPDSAMCRVCVDLWRSGHFLFCPRDSKYWDDI